MARRGARVLADWWRAAVFAGARVAHGVTRWAAHAYHVAAHVVGMAVHDVARAVGHAARDVLRCDVTPAH